MLLNGHSIQAHNRLVTFTCRMSAAPTLIGEAASGCGLRLTELTTGPSAENKLPLSALGSESSVSQPPSLKAQGSLCASVCLCAQMCIQVCVSVHNERKGGREGGEGKERREEGVEGREVERGKEERKVRIHEDLCKFLGI